MAGRSYESSKMSVLLPNNWISSEAIEALLSPGPSHGGFPGSGSVMNFEDVHGQRPEWPFCRPFELEETGDEDLDEGVHRPEKKRRLTADQVQFLERSFELENKLEPERKVQLARDIGLQPRQVAIWFQNRRARWKMGASPWALAGKTIMEGTLSVWGRQEGVEELKARLLLTTLELESFRTNAQEEIRMNQESMSKLVHLLNITRQERDEARRQLQSLLNKTILGSPVDLCSPVSHPQPQSQEIKPMGATPNMKKPDCPSNPSNQYSHVVPFADAESSPDMSNLNMLHPSNTQLQQQPILLEHNNSTGISSNLAKFDRASVVIDRLVSKRTLPEKGRLVQTVMEAGPLLQTLLVAGPLPQWRNPPPLKPIQIPPVAAQGSNTEIPNQFPVLDPDYDVNSSPDASLYKISQIGSEMDATSDSNSLGAADSCLKQAMLTYHASSYESLTKKLGSQ